MCTACTHEARRHNRARAPAVSAWGSTRVLCACHARAMRVLCACRRGQQSNDVCGNGTVWLALQVLDGRVRVQAHGVELVAISHRQVRLRVRYPIWTPDRRDLSGGGGSANARAGESSAYVGVHGSERRYCRKGRAQSSTNRSKSLLSTASSSSRSRSGTTASARCCAHACLHLTSQARADAHRFDLAARVRACLIRPGTEHAGW